MINMIVPNTARPQLVYFAYPKCASEYIRQSLSLENIYTCVPYDWDASDLTYCHCRPSRFVRERQLTHATLFTLVRNPFDRLVSAWSYAVGKDLPYRNRQDDTFAGFVRMLYSHRTTKWRRIPMYWMILPVEHYFAGMLDKVHMFRVEDQMEDAKAFVHRFTGDIPWLQDRVNVCPHAPYTTYYTEELKAMVSEIYRWELIRFGYQFGD